MRIMGIGGGGGGGGVAIPLINNLTYSDDGRQFTVAARNCDVKSMKKMLKAGVDINSRHPLGWSALHTAVINASWSVMEFLVENWADVNAKDDFSSASRVAAQERVSSSRGVASLIAD